MQRKLLRNILLGALILILFLCPGLVLAGSQQTSSTLASAIISNARYLLNDDSQPYFFTDTELLVWVNDGIQDIATRCRCMETTENVVLVTSTLEYALSTNYIGITSAIYNDGSSYKGLLRATIQDVGHARDAGEPVYYYEWNGKIGFDPLPGSGVNGNTVTVYMIERPSAVTASQSVPTPAYFDNALTWYVVSKGLAKDRQLAKASDFEKRYFDALDRFRVDYTEQPKVTKEAVIP